MVTCAVGVGLNYGVHCLSRRKTPAVATVQPALVDIAPTTHEFPVFVAPTVTPSYSRPTNLVLDYDLDKYARYGELHILGSAPEGFEDFYFIALSLGAGGHVDYPGYIQVYTGSDDNWDSAAATFALVTDRLLYFTTEPSEEHGFEYRFEGEFLVKDFESVAGKNKAAVRGKLTKFRNGRKLAEQTLTFRMEYLEGC